MRQSETDMAKDALNAEQAAQKIGVSRPTLYRWIKRGWVAAPATDYKGDMAFTVADVRRITAWKERIVRKKGAGNAV